MGGTTKSFRALADKLASYYSGTAEQAAKLSDLFFDSLCEMEQRRLGDLPLNEILDAAEFSPTEGLAA
jgi:hypothetical protein